MGKTFATTVARIRESGGSILPQIAVRLGFYTVTLVIKSNITFVIIISNHSLRNMFFNHEIRPFCT